MIVTCNGGQEHLRGFSIAALARSAYPFAMTTTMEAWYHDGKLILPGPLPLANNARVRIVIETPDTAVDADRVAWLRVSEQALASTWDKSADDVFNELLAK